MTGHQPSHGDNMLLGRMMAGVEALGRSGASNFELHDESEPIVAWWATATWGDDEKRVTSERFPYPAQAVEDLVGRVLNGGVCMRCKRHTVIGLAVEGHCSFLLIAPKLDDPETYRYVRTCEAADAHNQADAGGHDVGRYRVRGTGRKVKAREVAALEPKQPGRHRWLVFSAYVISDGQAAAAESGSTLELRPEMLWTFDIGCIDCENEFRRVRAMRCDGEEYVPAERGGA